MLLFAKRGQFCAHSLAPYNLSHDLCITSMATQVRFVREDKGMPIMLKYNKANKIDLFTGLIYLVLDLGSTVMWPFISLPQSPCLAPRLASQVFQLHDSFVILHNCFISLTVTSYKVSAYFSTAVDLKYQYMKLHELTMLRLECTNSASECCVIVRHTHLWYC